MAAILIDGKKTAAEIRANLRDEVADFERTTGVVPGLATVLVGDNPASQVYIRSKVKSTEECGMRSRHHDLPASTSQHDLLKLIDELNRDPGVHGILVQLPLPAGMDERAIIEAIVPHKDVDGFHPLNMGALTTGQPGLVPCTPLGVMQLLKHYNIALSGQNAVVLGRSNIVGKPAALLLLQQDATVTILHSRSQDLAKKISEADILIAAVGRPNFVQGSWIKEGAVVIDVGINRLDNGKLCGDVQFDVACSRAGWITPVPGGVGPMTIAMLLSNTLTAARRQHTLKGKK